MTTKNIEALQIDSTDLIPNPTPADLAVSFLSDRKFIGDGGKKILYWNEDYYLFNGRNYERHPREYLKSTIVLWLQQKTELRIFAKTTVVNNILLNIDGMTILERETKLQSKIGASTEFSPHLVNMKNGILNLRDISMENTLPLTPHSPEFFSTACLPFDYNPKVQCPKWLRFLEEVQPDNEVRTFLQDWIGYNLTFDTTQQRFVLFVGEGANGKTVVCVVLRALLGNHNVSAVGLEAFSPTRTFPLAATVGKLANIVAELNDVDRTSEGELKKFVSGEFMTVERKHRDPFEFRPTARLTFASNVLPRFTDRSDGVWRRLIVVPFSVQILDEKKQDKRLVDQAFWESSGELPGIFNWALIGLARLHKRGYFAEPLVCHEAKTSFKRDSSPAKTFLQEFCAVKKEREISSRELYQAYSEYLKSNGQHPLSEPLFGQEVRRVFPNANKSKNAVRIFGNSRSHMWYGIHFTDPNS